MTKDLVKRLRDLRGGKIVNLTPQEIDATLTEVADALDRENELIKRLEQAETIIAHLTMDHNSGPNYVRGFDMAQEHFAKYPNAPEFATHGGPK